MQLSLTGSLHDPIFIYNLLSDLQYESPSDKNECEDGCQNFEGGFNCSCDNGFLLSENGRDCISKRHFCHT